MNKLNKNEPQVVFSACNGISTGLYCLKQMGVNISKYLSSEIDRYALAVSAHNHPEDDVIQLGDLNNVTLEDIKDTTLFLCASPCQNLSAINANRKGIYGEGSNLFFKAVDLMNELNEYRKSIGLGPVPFLFENVGSASKEDIQIMNEALNCEGMRVNSELTSGSLRNRIYWFNWEADQPKDQGIKLQDILENGCALKDKANALLTAEPSMSAKGLGRVLKRSIGNLIITDPDFAQVPKDKMVDEFNRITDNGILKDKIPFRKLTINEREALMNLPKGYVDNAPISHTRKIRCLGNGWDAGVITFLLGKLFTEM